MTEEERFEQLIEQMTDRAYYKDVIAGLRMQYKNDPKQLKHIWNLETLLLSRHE